MVVARDFERKSVRFVLHVSCECKGHGDSDQREGGHEKYQKGQGSRVLINRT